MSKKLINHGIYVKKSPIHGYGVFASQDLAPGELLEECHTLLFESDSYAFNNYKFKWADDVAALPLGNGAIYNHSDKPNAHCEFDTVNNLMLFKVNNPIKKDQEIFISYGKYWLSERNIKEKKLSKALVLLNPVRSFPLRLVMTYTVFFGIVITLTVISKLH